jgi:hypothetical protein
MGGEVTVPAKAAKAPARRRERKPSPAAASDHSAATPLGPMSVAMQRLGARMAQGGDQRAGICPSGGIHPGLTDQLIEAMFSVEAAVERREGIGGPARSRVLEAIGDARARSAGRSGSDQSWTTGSLVPALEAAAQKRSVLDLGQLVDDRLARSTCPSEQCVEQCV